MTVDDLITELVSVLRECELGYTPNSGYTMCNSCGAVKSPDHYETELAHESDCKAEIILRKAAEFLESKNQ